MSVTSPSPAAPPVSDARTLGRALKDLRDGFAHRELWLELGWQDVKQRYRRSVIGPFWITIATGVMAASLALLWSVLLGANLRTMLPQVTVGLIMWNFIQSSILEGSEVFIKNEGLIKQLPAPLSVHVYRLVWRQVLFLLHNIAIYVVVIIAFPPLHWSFSMLLALPAFALLVLNAAWVTMFFGILATRYRDIAPLLTALTQLLFYATPVVWSLDTVPKTHGNAERARIVEINPLYHYLEIIRAPMIGKEQHLYHWLIVIGCTLVGWVLTMLLMKQYRSRVAYWV
ncbi:ABC transporter permease [Tsukamurella sp. 8F]|uniref:galactan export ABC transporter permease subunit Wzm/RfbD n=1 Tax=unclassified Tsukamurella TaxID=2633480 RepID=UPI0023B92483|nr:MULTISPECIES: ABC transporter permease [unclassified Tsukamurella]MDF0531809.1 ABC transporter permease [Tsukamurella sp. 8J]MDF0589051.1 ABC transporter permease [Tsukamurella sp. 8F]